MTTYNIGYNLKKGAVRLFGYVITNAKALGEDRQGRFQAYYCGLCRTLRARHGLAGGVTLSYDMTFLAMLLHALYEPDERNGTARCPAHPMKRRAYVESPVMTYVADINVALAYHKLMDNWRDDRSLPSVAEAWLLRRAYARASAAQPDKCRAIEAWIEEIRDYESANLEEIDLPVNATGRLLGELFARDAGDIWADALRAVGDGLGRFIYFMDAYEDLPQDVRRGRYNPLKPLRRRDDYEQFCRDAMTMMVADATQAYEQLPILLDADILRNILYSGVWSRYAYLLARREAKRKGEK